jgi:hypothetical protein
LIGSIYAKRWLGLIGVFPQKHFEFHLVNFSRGDGSQVLPEGLGLMRSGTGKSLAIRINIDDFLKNTDFFGFLDGLGLGEWQADRCAHESQGCRIPHTLPMVS